VALWLVVTCIGVGHLIYLFRKLTLAPIVLSTHQALVPCHNRMTHSLPSMHRELYHTGLASDISRTVNFTRTAPCEFLIIPMICHSVVHDAFYSSPVRNGWLRNLSSNVAPCLVDNDRSATRDMVRVYACVLEPSDSERMTCIFIASHEGCRDASICIHYTS
jgi:hypothetical protein